MINPSDKIEYGWLVEYIKENGGIFSDWYCGITENPSRSLFEEHNVSKASDSKWRYDECRHTSEYGNIGARSVAKALIEDGCDGNNRGDDSKIFVYIYKKTSTTKH